MKIENDKIYIFKMVSGEEIVAKVVDSNDQYIQVSNAIMMAPTQHGLQMIPAMMSANQEKSVYIHHTGITIIGEVRDDVETAYIQATTGISIPENKKLILG